MTQKISALIRAGATETRRTAHVIIEPRYKSAFDQHLLEAGFATCAWGAALYAFDKNATVKGFPFSHQLLGDDMTVACGVDKLAVLPTHFLGEPEVARYWKEYHPGKEWFCNIEELVYGLNDYIGMSREDIAALLERHGY